MIIKNILSFIILFLLISCTKKDQTYTVENIDGIKTFKNTSTPAESELKVELTKLFTIKGEDENSDDSLRTFLDIAVIDVDENDNIYILSSRKSAIKKFDKDGEFITSFGRRGTGPGESQFSWNMTVFNDTVLFDDYNSKQMLRFTSEGEFIDKIKILESGPPERFMSNKTNIIGYQVQNEETKDQFFISYNPVIWDSKFNKLHKLYNMKVEFNRDKYNFFDLLLSAYTVSDNKIFYAVKSKDKYQVNVYDMNGKHNYTILKNYIRTAFTEQEKEKFDKDFSNVWYFSNNKSQYKYAIIQMEYDKFGRLWVFSSIKRDENNLTMRNVDIFKDGIYLNTVDLGICPGYDYMSFDYQIILRNNRLFLINRLETELAVYDYK